MTKKTENLIEWGVVPLPVQAFYSKAIKSPERLMQFVQLVAITAARSGVKDAKGSPVRLRKGQALVSLEDLGRLWGMSRFTARNALGIFEKAGLITCKRSADAADDLRVGPDSTVPDATLISINYIRE